MSATKIRLSKQVFVDDHFDLNGKKIINAADPTTSTDLATKQYVDNATSGVGSSVHTPVQNATAAKAIGTTGRADKMLMNIEDLGLFRFDAESTATSDDVTVIRPTDVANDTLAGRWVKMSSSLSDHNLMSNIQGGGVGDYQHFTTAEKTAATRNAGTSQNGLLSSTDWNTFNGKLSGSNKITRETPSGAKNGSNTTFTLAYTPIAGSEEVFVDGVLMSAGAGEDYTITGATITLAVAPLSSCKIFVNYWK